MKDIVVWLIHTPAGTIGLVSAMIALLANKGGAAHRKAGVLFTISMLIMLLSGFVAALLKESAGDMFLSVVVIYTVFTAWLTTYHKTNETGILEHIALGWILAISLAGIFMITRWSEPETPSPYYLLVGFAVSCSIGDINNIYQGGLSGIHRIIRHVWRIGFSLTWAVLSVIDKIIKIQGANIKEMPKEEVIYIVGVPATLALIIIMYWIINIGFFSRAKFSAYS